MPRARCALQHQDLRIETMALENTQAFSNVEMCRGNGVSGERDAQRAQFRLLCVNRIGENENDKRKHEKKHSSRVISEPARHLASCSIRFLQEFCVLTPDKTGRIASSGVNFQPITFRVDRKSTRLNSSHEWI